MFDTDPGQAPTVTVTHESGSGPDVAGSISSVTETQITFTVTTAAGNDTDDLLTWNNVSVEPAAGTPLASGEIYETGTADLSDVTQGPGGTNWGTLAEVAGAAAQLEFQTEPSDTTYGDTISPGVTVAFIDQFGNLTSSSETVTLALESNPTNATLGGNSSTLNGSGNPVWNNLTVNKVGPGYTLEAIASGMPLATSTPFEILGAADHGDGGEHQDLRRHDLGSRGADDHLGQSGRRRHGQLHRDLQHQECGHGPDADAERDRSTTATAATTTRTRSCRCRRA